jgi:hypothetical protein
MNSVTTPMASHKLQGLWPSSKSLIGVRVQIFGLTGAIAMNGATGTCKRFAAAGMYVVEVG